MQRKSIGELTSNQYYGGLNRRFDKRIRLIRKFGFVGVPRQPFYARRVFGTDQTIHCSVLLHSHNRVFHDKLRELLRR